LLVMNDVLFIIMMVTYFVAFYAELPRKE